MHNLNAIFAKNLDINKQIADKLHRQGRRIKKHSHPKVLTDNFHPIPP